MPAPENSRRAFLSGIFAPLKAVSRVPEKEAKADQAQAQARSALPDTRVPKAEALIDFVAIVQGRHCIATTGFCRSCIERCPAPGAIELNQGVPMVVPAACTGCRICHDVCPAPTNAILMLKRRADQARPAPSPIDE